MVVNASNLGALKVKAKYQHIHKFLAVTNNAERWIDINGMLPDVHKDNAVKRKQDMFTLMFNLSVF